MLKKWEAEKTIQLLEIGIGKIKKFGDKFVAYNTKYLGHSFSGDYTIKGKTTRDSVALNEFCYGYDGEYGQLHLLHVFQTKEGFKYASIEISMCVYAFWEILE